MLPLFNNTSKRDVASVTRYLDTLLLSDSFLHQNIANNLISNLTVTFFWVLTFGLQPQVFLYTVFNRIHFLLLCPSQSHGSNITDYFLCGTEPEHLHLCVNSGRWRPLLNALRLMAHQCLSCSVHWLHTWHPSQPLISDLPLGQ